jgi:hypothetical protein
MFNTGLKKYESVTVSTFTTDTIYVNRLEPESKHTAVDKMKRVLRVLSDAL